jgi:NAD(P)-dependent dehydrogenase (short-subunit alcohol dehydrogenase family)
VDEVDWAAGGRGNPGGRVGTPEVIAGIAIFLSSRAGAYPVGDVILCDGGVVVS